MKKLLLKVAVVGITGGSLLTGATALAASANAAPAGRASCPSGDACLYDGAPGTQSYQAYYHYGAHNLSGVTGDHYFFNAQTNNAKAYLCTGYNGDGTCTLVKADTGVTKNFTPINSIYLEA